MLGRIPIDLTPDIAAELLPLLERKRPQKAAELAELDADIRKVKLALNGYVKMPEQKFIEPAPPGPNDTADGRIRRGQAQVIVAKFLEQKNGDGATIGEIISATGLIYGTTKRALKALKKDKKVRSYGGTFRIAAPSAT